MAASMASCRAMPASSWRRAGGAGDESLLGGDHLRGREAALGDIAMGTSRPSPRRNVTDGTLGTNGEDVLGEEEPVGESEHRLNRRAVGERVADRLDDLALRERRPLRSQTLRAGKPAVEALLLQGCPGEAARADGRGPRTPVEGCDRRGRRPRPWHATAAAAPRRRCSGPWVGGSRRSHAALHAPPTRPARRGGPRSPLGGSRTPGWRRQGCRRCRRCRCGPASTPTPRRRVSSQRSCASYRCPTGRHHANRYSAGDVQQFRYSPWKLHLKTTRFNPE